MSVDSNQKTSITCCCTRPRQCWVAYVTTRLILYHYRGLAPHCGNARYTIFKSVRPLAQAVLGSRTATKRSCRCKDDGQSGSRKSRLEAHKQPNEDYSIGLVLEIGRRILCCSWDWVCVFCILVFRRLSFAFSLSLIITITTATIYGLRLNKTCPTPVPLTPHATHRNLYHSRPTTSRKYPEPVAHSPVRQFRPSRNDRSGTMPWRNSCSFAKRPPVEDPP